MGGFFSFLAFWMGGGGEGGLAPVPVGGPAWRRLRAQQRPGITLNVGDEDEEDVLAMLLGTEY